MTRGGNRNFSVFEAFFFLLEHGQATSNPTTMEAATMSLQIPVPASFLAAVWFGIELTFGKEFGKNLDHAIKITEWYSALLPWQQWLVSRARLK